MDGGVWLGNLAQRSFRLGCSFVDQMVSLVQVLLKVLCLTPFDIYILTDTGRDLMPWSSALIRRVLLTC